MHAPHPLQLASAVIAVMADETFAQDTHGMEFTEFQQCLAVRLSGLLKLPRRRSTLTDRVALGLLDNQPAARDHYLRLRAQGRTIPSALNAAVRQINKTARHD